MIGKTSPKGTKLAFYFLSAAVFMLLASGVVSASHAVTLRVGFTDHLEAALAEQDVFVEKVGLSSDQVVRVEPDDTLSNASVLYQMVYAAATATPHDPFKTGPNPLGPFAKGKLLGFTLFQWLSSSGQGTYLSNGTDALLSLNFQGLVPKGVYTVGCRLLTSPPSVNIVDAPCGAPDGSQNVFTADGVGAAQISIGMPALPDSTNKTASLVTVVYHSDGKTYGASPGDYGLNSHMQLIYVVPVPEEAPPQPPPPIPATPTTAANGAERTLSGYLLGLIVLLVVVAFCAWYFMKRRNRV